MDTVEQRAIRRISKRLIPLITISFFINFLDRTNIGIAALQMNRDLGLTASMFGFGAGLFFVTYCIFEVPSNLLLEKFGARRWIARIMLTWGVIAGGMAFVQGSTSFYILRALLGVAEAGFFPGMIFYLTMWFPEAYRGRAMSYLVVAAPVSFLVGGPLSGSLLNLNGLLNLRGWQWLFIVEAAPAIIMSVIILTMLTDRPSEARWLAQEERDWLTKQLNEERRLADGARSHSVIRALTSPKVLMLAAANFSVVLNVYGVVFFLPQIAKGFGVSDLRAGWITAIPFIAATFGILWAGRRSDIQGERRFHTAVPIIAMALAMVVAASVQNPYVKMVAFSVVAFGAYCSIPPFWALPTTLLSGAAAAGGIALINSIGNLGGFAGPWIMGLAKDITGNFSSALLAMAVMDVIAVLIVLSFRAPPSTMNQIKLRQVSE
ncbi:MFS transporter [Caballeronia sp. RCC_10]|uniref:MFS transporter n=1 Tax=Caballeronia sp. RCC_10 TaxID=3239227 RepID=UPI003523305D